MTLKEKLLGDRRKGTESELELQCRVISGRHLK